MSGQAMMSQCHCGLHPVAGGMNKWYDQVEMLTSSFYKETVLFAGVYMRFISVSPFSMLKTKRYVWGLI